MSPSWIERSLARACRAVVFQRHSVTVSTGWRWRGRFRVSHQTEVALPDGFFDAAGLGDIQPADLLATRLREAVPACLPHVPVWVALPDALADVLTFSLQRGLSIRAAQAVLTGRLQRELAWARAPGLAIQRVGRTGERDTWLAAAIDADLHARVHDALVKGGMTPWSMRPAALWRHDALRMRFAPDQRSAFASVDGDGPSLMFWGPDRHVRWCRARWDGANTNTGTNTDAGTQAGTATDTPARVEAIRRLCLQYVHADANHSIESLHLLVHDEAAARLADQLDQHLQRPCLRHVPPEGVCVSTMSMVGLPWPCPWPAPSNQATA